jgi:GH18 family chitinase
MAFGILRVQAIGGLFGWACCPAASRRAMGGLALAVLLGPLAGILSGAETLVVGYAPNWVEPAVFAAQVAQGPLTRIDIAFENPQDDAGNLPCTATDTALIALARAHHLQVLLSIGGGAASGDKLLLARYASLLAAVQRAAFIAKLVAWVVEHDCDGLDVDLEGPTIGPDYGPFIADLAPALHARGKLLTAALSQGYGGDHVPPTVFAHLDAVQVMAYDEVGSWAPANPGQHSSLAFARATVAWWLARGLPREKLVLGVPFYGYGFGAAFRNEPYSYKDIVAAYPGAAAVDQVGSTIWYNGIPTITAKTALVRAEGLGGIMIWSLDGDAPGKDALLGAIGAALRH